MPLTAAEQADEMLVMGLRIVEGVDLARLAGLTGLAPSRSMLAELTDLGMIEHDPRAGRVRASGRGRFLINAIVLKLSLALEPCGMPWS